METLDGCIQSSAIFSKRCSMSYVSGLFMMLFDIEHKLNFSFSILNSSEYCKNADVLSS
jgi:hypothetical protein